MASGAGGGGVGGASAIRAGAAYVELFLKDNMLTRGLAKWQGKLASAGASLLGAGGATLGAGAAITAPLAGLAAMSVKTRVEMGSLAAKIGENVTTLSRFAYAAQANGISLQDLEGHWENLSERILQAADGSGEASMAFQKLGINARSMIGMGRVEQMLTLADAFGNVTDATTRNAIQSGLGGDRFQQLNSLFASGRSQIEKLMRESDHVGFTQSEEQTKRATAANLAWLRVKTAATGALLAIGDAILGPSDTIEDLADRVVMGIKTVRLFIQENQGLIRTIFMVGLGIAGVGVALVTLGAGLSAVSMGMGLVKSGIMILPAIAKGLFAVLSGGFALLTSPVGLFVAAVVGLGVLFFTQTELGRSWAESIGEYFIESKDNALAAWGGIVDAIKAGDINLAWGIVTALLDLEWQRLWGSIKAGARAGFEFLDDGWRSGVFVIKNLWIDLKEFIVDLSAKMVRDSLKAIAEVAPQAANFIGDIAGKVNERAGAVIKVGGMVAGMVAGNLGGNADAAIGVNKVNAQAERNAAQTAFETDKAVRQFVLGVAAKNDADTLTAAQERLAALTNMAAAAAMAEAGKKMSDGSRRMSGLFGGVMGTFSTFALANRVTTSVQQKQLREAEKTNTNLDTLIDTVTRLNGPVFT